jgi:hypothetical protein
VYNEANEKIGDINDVILDRSGKVANVILGVGGVRGQPVTSTTASTTSAPANAPATTSAADGPTRTTSGAATTHHDNHHHQPQCALVSRSRGE